MPESDVHLIRGRGATFWIIVIAGAGALLLGDAAINGSVEQAVRVAPIVLIIIWVAYVFIWSPHVRADERGVTVANPLRITNAGWKAIDEITSRWQVEFRLTDGQTVQAWAMPIATRRRRQPTREERDGEPVRGGMGTFFGVGRGVRQLAPTPTQFREGLDDMREQYYQRSDAQITRGWNISAIVALAVIVIWFGAVSATGGMFPGE